MTKNMYTPGKKLLGVKDVAARLNCTPGSIYRWRVSGLLPMPVQKRGNRHFWTPGQIDEWASEHIKYIA